MTARTTLFVGGPRHGRTVDMVPKEESELYRVPATSKKDKATDYKAARIILTFPDVTGKPQGETYAAWLWVIPELYPDNPQRSQLLQSALGEALMRGYCMANGDKTSGGPEAVMDAAMPELVAWCETTECEDHGMTHTFESLRDRASWMSRHITNGHQARWDDRTKVKG